MVFEAQGRQLTAKVTQHWGRGATQLSCRLPDLWSGSFPQSSAVCTCRRPLLCSLSPPAESDLQHRGQARAEQVVWLWSHQGVFPFSLEEGAAVCW